MSRRLILRTLKNSVGPFTTRFYMSLCHSTNERCVSLTNQTGKSQHKTGCRPPLISNEYGATLQCLTDAFMKTIHNNKNKSIDGIINILFFSLFYRINSYAHFCFLVYILYKINNIWNISSRVSTLPCTTVELVTRPLIRRWALYKDSLTGTSVKTHPSVVSTRPQKIHIYDVVLPRSMIGCCSVTNFKRP